VKVVTLENEEVAVAEAASAAQVEAIKVILRNVPHQAIVAAVQVDPVTSKNEVAAADTAATETDQAEVQGTEVEETNVAAVETEDTAALADAALAVQVEAVAVILESAVHHQATLVQVQVKVVTLENEEAAVILNVAHQAVLAAVQVEAVTSETGAAEVAVADMVVTGIDQAEVQGTAVEPQVVQAAAAINAPEAEIESGDKTAVQIRVKPHPYFPSIFNLALEDGAKRLATKSFAPGKSVYGERLVRFEGVEYRVWDAFRSKLAGAIWKGLKTVPVIPGHKMLYLGAASGTTPSHISDIVGEEGHVYCIEFAQRSLRDLVANVIVNRSNMSPFLADARMPQKYAMYISEKVDEVYCDIAQPEQAKVLADNADVFLKAGGWVLLAVKSQSIDVTRPPAEVYEMEARVLENRGFRVEQIVDLEPYDIAHAMIVAQR
jgi:fibrillarin-like pre-rRNA processing protein